MRSPILSHQTGPVQARTTSQSEHLCRIHITQTASTEAERPPLQRDLHVAYCKALKAAQTNPSHSIKLASQQSNSCGFISL